MSSPGRTMRVGLAQIGDQFGQDYYLPYALGLLQAYAQRHAADPSAFTFSLPVYRRMRVSDAADALQDSDIVFFSSYVWNYRLNLSIAAELRQRGETPILAFGGPHIPGQPAPMQQFMADHPFVDVASYGEGEIPFLGILENAGGRTWSRVPSVGYRDGNTTVLTPPAPPIEDLDSIPSPFLSGIFDTLMEANPGVSWSGLLETNRGCPFTCAFCYWGCSDSKVRQFSMDRVKAEIDWISRRQIEFIFCCDANFGLLDRDNEIAMKVAHNKAAFGYPKAFSIQNTKNSTERIFQIQKTLRDHGLQRGVNLALQSLNAPTLKSIHRFNIKNETYRQLQQLFTREGIPTFTDLIVGLPDETYDSFVKGVGTLIDSGQHNRIQFIDLVILPNTTMADPDYQKQHGLVVQEAFIIPHHTRIEEEPEVRERQGVVVGSRSMPTPDWVKAKTFCWTTSLFYFGKLLQIPLAVAAGVSKFPMARLLESLATQDERFPTFREINTFFLDKARAIQNGDVEFCPSKEWLGIWWPADELAFIRLCTEKRLDAFYEEAIRILESALGDSATHIPSTALRDAVALNRRILRLPFRHEPSRIELGFNVYEVYRSYLLGESFPLKQERCMYDVDADGPGWTTWADWARDVVWYGTKRGDYLLGLRRTEVL